MQYKEAAKKITEAIRKSILKKSFSELAEPSSPKQSKPKSFFIEAIQIQLNVNKNQKISRASSKRSSIGQSESSSPQIKSHAITLPNILSSQQTVMSQDNDKNDYKNHSKTTQLQNQKTDQSINSDAKSLQKKRDDQNLQREDSHKDQEKEVEEENLNPEKEGNMKYGDIVTFFIKQVKIKTAESEFFQEYANSYIGIIYAEGIAFTPIQTIPFQSAGTNSAQQTFQCCLFRIECAAKPNHQAAEMQRMIGQDVHFGDFIQLRHIHSKEFISLDLEVQNQVAKEYGCLRVAISEQGIHLQVLGANKLKEIGQLVTYSDHIFLACFQNKAKYYLHCSEKFILGLDSRVEINASEISTT